MLDDEEERGTPVGDLGNVVVIRQKMTIDASPAEVYKAYVDPKKHSNFTGSPAKGSPRVGGHFTAWNGYISGKFLELEKEKRIVHE